MIALLAYLYGHGIVSVSLLVLILPGIFEVAGHGFGFPHRGLLLGSLPPLVFGGVGVRNVLRVGMGGTGAWKKYTSVYSFC
jgi:hypothetical protein